MPALHKSLEETSQDLWKDEVYHIHIVKILTFTFETKNSTNLYSQGEKHLTHLIRNCNLRELLQVTGHYTSHTERQRYIKLPKKLPVLLCNVYHWYTELLTLVYRDGNLLSGSLDALIQHMVPTDVYYPDRAYIFAFLLSSRLFIKPHDLLAKMRNLYEIQQGLSSSTNAAATQTASRSRFAEHLVELLAEWTDTFPYDFRDERVMQHVQTVTQQCCIINPSLRSNVSSILHNLLQRLTALENYEKSLEKPEIPLDDLTEDISEICPHPSVLAQQLTQLELERLSYIGPEEFVQAFANENLLLETSFKDMKKTRNLEQYVQWFNRLSYFVATQVCRWWSLGLKQSENASILATLTV
ncbi:hypothetical protein HHI36_018776 [Cryptolaemus montrouzieri]|uniref:Ras-GEF domain-containing protein n=1 Tax=Cryptolaemus montrouzieri TaxID=559131 RepID=A0ABD2P1Q3_9CUCU